MLDRLDCLQRLLPSNNKHAVVPMYMFATERGLPIVVRLNMRNSDKSLPVMLIAFDIDLLATSVCCEIQYPRDNVTFRLYGQLTSNRFHIGTHEINGWPSLEALAIAWIASAEPAT